MKPAMCPFARAPRRAPTGSIWQRCALARFIRCATTTLESSTRQVPSALWRMVVQHHPEFFLSALAGCVEFGTGNEAWAEKRLSSVLV